MAKTPPDFRWASFYYNEILAALIELKRRSWPEHTEEDPNDPVIQLYRAFAVVAHLQAVRLDHAAREVYLPTARLRSSVIALARLVDYELAPAVPAETYLLASVSGSLSGSTRLVRAHSVFGTDGDDGAAVLFEYDEDDDLYGGPTGSLTVLRYDSGTWTDITGAIPSPLFGGSWATSNDAIYVGGTDLAFNKLAIEITAASAAAWWRWEYRDDRSGQPDDVTDNGDGTITLEVDSVVGASASSGNGGEASGLTVIVRCMRTGVSESCEIDGGTLPNKITTTGTLGQTTISVNAADYVIETEWVELPGQVDGTAGLMTVDDTTVGWALPFDAAHRWIKSDPAGLGVDAYWIRARLARLGNAAPPTITTIGDARKTTWAVEFAVRQGRRVVDKLGASDGTASQRFKLNRSPFLALVSLTVDGEGWAEVDNFLSSAAHDRHFTLDEEPDGSWWISFGDGTAGKAPAASAVIVATYRIGGDVSGNVGAGTITRDRTGNSKIKAITNYAAATGWEAQEGTTAASLNALRVEIPASLRVRSRAVTVEDYQNLAEEFTTADGSSPVARALAVEETGGPKTVGLYCVGPSGEAPSAEDLAELATYLNGEVKGLQRVGGVVPANMLALPGAYTPRTVNVTVQVKVLEDYADGAAARVEAALKTILLPTATRLVKDTDGTWVDSGIYLWTWGGEVDPAVLLGAIYTSTPGIVGIDLSAPSAAFTLATGELPIYGSITVTVVEV